MAAPSNLGSTDQQFYTWCSEFCAYVSLTYGINFTPVFIHNPDNGNPFGPGYLYYLVASQNIVPQSPNKVYQIDTGFMYLWPNQAAMSQLAPLILSALSAPYAPPGPIPPPAPVVVTPPAPTDPIGAAFVYDPTRWIDTGAPGFNVGQVYPFPQTANHPAGSFTKHVSAGLFGTQYWWTAA